MVYFTGVALLAASVSIIIKKKAALATLLLGVFFILTALLVHLPGGEESMPNLLKDVALAGAALFNGSAGCSSCHSYDDQGGNVGPVLDGVSSRLGEDALLQALINPSASIANGYGVKVVEQVDGTMIRGRYRNDSELAVQIQSEDGRRWVTYFKDRVKSVTDSDESLMPDVYATLGAEQQEQLLAFLHSL